jgi:PhnB protein
MTDATPVVAKGLIPHLVCSPCADAIEFYQKAFDAEEVYRLMSLDGERIMHAELRIGGAVVMLADDFPEYCGGQSRTPIALGGTPVSLHRYVDDCDAAMQKAEAAGATIKMPATDMFWGDRYGMVTDPFGHEWSLATHQKDLTHDEIAEAMKAACQQPQS